MPNVSIIIPTYNRLNFLHQAIHSVLRQPYSDFEIIVVNDGSNASLYDAILAYSDDRILYFEQEHAGRSAARNLGLKKSNGAYIAFLDDDDYYLPNKLTDQLEYLLQHPEVDLAASGAQYVTEQDQLIEYWIPWNGQEEITLLQSLYSCPMLTSTVLFRRDVLDRMDEWFDPDMHVCEDGDFFVRMLYAGCRAVWVKSIVAAYRLHGQSSNYSSEQCNQAHQRKLDKCFNLPEISNEVLQKKSSIYAYHHLAAACRLFYEQKKDQAISHLEQAYALDPQQTETRFFEIAAKYVGIGYSDPRTYLNYVFDNLPNALSSLKHKKMQAFQHYLKERMTRQPFQGSFQTVKTEVQAYA